MSQHEETTGFGVSRVMDRDIQLNIIYKMNPGHFEEAKLEACKYTP